MSGPRAATGALTSSQAVMENDFARAGRRNKHRDSARHGQRRSCPQCRDFLAELREKVTFDFEGTSAAEHQKRIRKAVGEDGDGDGDGDAVLDPEQAEIALLYLDEFAGGENSPARTVRVPLDVSFLGDNLSTTGEAYQALFGNSLPVLVGEERVLSTESVKQGWVERPGSEKLAVQEVAPWGSLPSPGGSFHVSTPPEEWSSKMVASFLYECGPLRDALTAGAITVQVSAVASFHGSLHKTSENAGNDARAKRGGKTASKKKSSRSRSRKRDVLDLLEERCEMARLRGPDLLSWPPQQQSKKRKDRTGTTAEEVAQLLGLYRHARGRGDGALAIEAGQYVLDYAQDLVEHLARMRKLPLQQQIHTNKAGVREPLYFLRDESYRAFSRDIVIDLPLVQEVESDSGGSSLGESDDSSSAAASDDAATDAASVDAANSASGSEGSSTAEDLSDEEETDDEEETRGGAGRVVTRRVVVQQIVRADLALHVARTEGRLDLSKNHRSALLGQRELKGRIRCPHNRTRRMDSQWRQWGHGTKVHQNFKKERTKTRSRAANGRLRGPEDVGGKSSPWF